MIKIHIKLLQLLDIRVVKDEEISINFDFGKHKEYEVLELYIHKDGKGMIIHFRAYSDMDKKEKTKAITDMTNAINLYTDAKDSD